MATISVADDGGDEMTLFNFNGYNYPNFPVRAIQRVASVKIRSDDVITCAYPKSGSHWVTEILTMLLLGTLDMDEGLVLRGLIDRKAEEEYGSLPSPRVLNSHVLYKHLPKDVKGKKPKIVFIIRNPKDVMVSYYNFIKKKDYYYYSGEWRNYLKPALEGKFDYGSWFDYTKDWEEVKKITDISILTVSYEDLKEDTFREAKKFRDFLEVERSDDFVKLVCDQCTFASMKQVNMNGDVVFRKGEVGDWKNWFTVAQNEWFDHLYQEKMKDCPLKFRYTLEC